MWFIPAGTVFPAKSGLVRAEDDLVVVYAGKLSELEKKANYGVLNGIDKINYVLLGGIIGFLSVFLAPRRKK